MKTIGLIGGMSFESTAVYYRMINEAVRERLGGLHSADVLVHSVDFQSIVELQKAGRWDAAGERLGAVAAGLERAGAECVLICTNTMHLVADAVQNAVSAPSSTSSTRSRATSSQPANAARCCSPRATRWSTASMRTA